MASRRSSWKFLPRSLNRNIKPYQLLRIVAVCFAVVYPIVLFALGVWVVRQSDSGSWLISEHYDPTTSPYGYAVGGDSWSQFLAGDEVVGLSDSNKDKVISVFSDDIWKIARSYGYDKREIDEWLRKTLQEYRIFPIKEIKLRNGRSVFYRDLSSLPFPKPHPFKMLWREIWMVDAKAWTWIILFTGLPTLVTLYLFITLGWMVASNQVPIMAKITVASLITIIVLGAWLYSRTQNKQIYGPSFSVVSLPKYGYVSAEGQWRGVDQKIAFPDNASRITCERGKESCKEIEAYLYEKSALRVDETDWPIVKWDEEEILAEQSTECAITKLMINYKDQAVTQIRVGRNPMPADCLTGGGKFITEMVSGIDIALGRFDGK